MNEASDGVKWDWGFVPKLLAQSLLYPIRAGNPLVLLKSLLIGGVLIVPFVVLLYGLSRGELGEAWRFAAEQGSVLTTFLILIVTFVLVMAVGPLGYFLRVIQRTSVEDATLPTPANWRTVAVDGAKVLAIYFFYLFFPLDVLRRFLGVFGEALPIIERTVPEFVLVFLVFLYLYPAAAGSFAEEGRLWSALPQRLKSVLWSRTYAVGAVTAGLIGGIIYLISSWANPADTTVIGLAFIGPTTFYLFVAQHYVIGRTWNAVGPEKPTTGSLEATAGDPVSDGRIDTGELRDRGVLSTEDVATIRGRFETAMRAPDPDTAEQLEALRTLYERGVFTRAEFEEKRREITSADRRTGPETESAGERSIPPKERTTGAEGTEAAGADPNPDGEATGAGREATPIGGVRTVGSEDAAGDASDRLERFAMLHQLYGQDVLTRREYEETQGRLGPDRESEGIVGNAGSELAERFDTLQGLYDRGLLTEEEYREKRRELLGEL